MELLDLPYELVRHILSQLPPTPLLVLSATSHRYLNLAREPSLWTAILRVRYPRVAASLSSMVDARTACLRLLPKSEFPSATISPRIMSFSDVLIVVQSGRHQWTFELASLPLLENAACVVNLSLGGDDDQTTYDLRGSDLHAAVLNSDADVELCFVRKSDGKTIRVQMEVDAHSNGSIDTFQRAGSLFPIPRAHASFKKLSADIGHGALEIISQEVVLEPVYERDDDDEIDYDRLDAGRLALYLSEEVTTSYTYDGDGGELQDGICTRLTGDAPWDSSLLQKIFREQGVREEAESIHSFMAQNLRIVS